MAKQHLEGMRAVILRWGAATPAEYFVRFAAMLATVLFLSAFSALPGLPVFGHDEVHYYSDFSLKLSEDGRWLNFLLHDFLRSIPPGTWASLFLALSWLLFYRLSRSLSFDAAYAALVASTVLLANPFVELALWPATAFPAVAILLAVSLLIERGMSHPLAYLLSGVLIFGTMQTFYFLMPLFFLPQFIQGTGSGESRWSLVCSHVFWWVAGSVVGVLVMSLVLWPVTGHFGPQPAEWRLTHPIQNATDLARNILYVSESFVQHVERLLRIVGVTYVNAVWFLLALLLAALLGARHLLASRQALLLLAAVLVSFFVFSIPLAPVIEQRSLVAMAAAGVLLVAFLPGSSALGRVLVVLLLLKISHGFSVRGEFYLGRHETETAFFYEKLQALMPGHPMTYSAIALYGTMDPGKLEARTFNDPSRMHPIVIALRAPEYLDCRLESRCDRVGTGRRLAVLPFVNGQLEFSVDDANVGIVRYLDGSGK